MRETQIVTRRVYRTARDLGRFLGRKPAEVVQLNGAREARFLHGEGIERQIEFE